MVVVVVSDGICAILVVVVIVVEDIFTVLTSSLLLALCFGLSTGSGGISHCQFARSNVRQHLLWPRTSAWYLLTRTSGRYRYSPITSLWYQQRVASPGRLVQLLCKRGFIFGKIDQCFLQLLKLFDHAKLTCPTGTVTVRAVDFPYLRRATNHWSQKELCLIPSNS